MRVLKEVGTEVSSIGGISVLIKQFQQQYVTIFISNWLDPANYQWKSPLTNWLSSIIGKHNRLKTTLIRLLCWLSYSGDIIDIPSVNISDSQHSDLILESMLRMISVRIYLWAIFSSILGFIPRLRANLSIKYYFY